MSRQLKYTVDVDSLKLSEQGRKVFEDQKKVFEDILHQGLEAVSPEGLGGARQRVFYRVLTALDETKDEYLNLEEEGFELLKEILESDKARFPSVNTRLIMAYRAALNDAKKGAPRQ